VERAVSKFLARTDWTPKATITLAGALLYRDYNWFFRLLLRIIAARRGGTTDTSRNHEYTQWDQVERFARDCAGRSGG
jgi:menaquinone-dependent protoporphyrinogen oxidase